MSYAKHSRLAGVCLGLFAVMPFALAETRQAPPVAEQRVPADPTPDIVTAPPPPESKPFSPAPVSTAPSPAAAEGRAQAIARFRAIAKREAEARGLPPAIADAVMRIESNYNPNARGKDGEYGLMQVMPPTARMLGHAGPVEQLADPEVNIRLGVRYLADAWRLGKGDICTATMKYRAGHGETRFSELSVLYCTRVRQHLASIGYPVTGEIPPATFGFRRDVTRMGIAIGTQQAAKRLASGRKLRSRASWAGYDNRMRELDRRGRVNLGL
jgi:soluble lytic murein transglycosylase-like protein